MPVWTKFLDDNRDSYYIPRNEIGLIGSAAKTSAGIVGGQPVTLVSRGCGTKFLAKEGLLLKHFSNVAGIVYLDRSEAALKQSLREGRSLLPAAWHKAIKADIYDPKLRYPVDGIEVGTSFGLTLMNIEGFPSGPLPRRSFIKNLSAIHAQAREGAHLIVTLDHNRDRESAEAAYAGQTEFAKRMLRQTGSLDADAVDFIVRLHESSNTLSHGFRFKNNQAVLSRSGTRYFSAGDILWFNNSVKPAIEDVREWNTASGFVYARPDVPMDHQNRLGWHHLIK